PYSELAREALARGAPSVSELIALADRLAADVRGHDPDWVVTHGEPHAANVMRTPAGHVLIDWDTVALAPPERDLWMLVEDAADEAAPYARATGHEPDEAAVSFYHLCWDLGDLAEYLNELRSPHRDTNDSRQAYEVVRNCVAIRDRWADLLD
ncbi:MAG: aminoglycoside phosphotransferase family protein, partial [Actinomycetota bacterium]|nr:aminoglycoside phosphotransferase family protein [Actinomycetota bacterium]